MSKIKIFLMLSGYQLTWLMCVFGDVLYNSYLPGLICGLLFLTICCKKVSIIVELYPSAPRVKRTSRQAGGNVWEQGRCIGDGTSPERNPFAFKQDDTSSCSN